MSSQTVLVTVGTDVHPFTRMIELTEALMARRPDLVVVVQHGTSRPAAGARNVEMLDAASFDALLHKADLVIAQGGPGGILEARAAGRVPLVMPRRSDLGEHVDDHQVAFTRRLADRGLIQLATDEAQFVDVAERLLSEPVAVEQDDGDADPRDRIREVLAVGPGADDRQSFVARIREAL